MRLDRGSIEKIVVAVRTGVIINKQASRLSRSELEHFSLLAMKSEEIFALHRNDLKLPSMISLVTGYTQSVVDLVATKSKVDETDDLQPLSRRLIDNSIVALNVPLVMRHGKGDIAFECVEIKGLCITGETDAAIYSGDVCIATWEDKNPTEDVSKSAHQAQTLTAISSAAAKFFSYCAVEPVMLCGMLTNGETWILFLRIFSDGRVIWRRTEPVSAVENSGKVASMLIEYFGAANALHEIVKIKSSSEFLAIARKRGIAETYSNNHDDNHENNEDSSGEEGSDFEGPPMKRGKSASNLSYDLTPANLRLHDYVTFTQLF